MFKHLMGLAIASALSQQMPASGTEAGGATAKAKKEEKPKVQVTMTDGRVVEFPEDTKAQKDLLFKHKETGQPTDDRDQADNPKAPIGVRWDFSNGETRTIMNAQIDNAGLGEYAKAHGIRQKGGDEYANVKDVDDCVIALDDITDRLLKLGEWLERREGGGFGGASVLAKAIVKVFGKSEEEVRAFLRDLKPQEKIALRQTPELKPEIERLEAEKAQGSKVDTKALMGKLAEMKSAQAQPAAA